jgi:membrane protease YdiL (CAAX protease family)
VTTVTTSAPDTPGGTREDEGRRRGRAWQLLAVLEVLGAAVAVVADLLVPTLVLLAMAAVSLGLRREGLASLGVRRVEDVRRLVAQMLAFSIAWTALSVAAFMPLANRLTGDRQDLSGFADLEGDLGLLLLLLAATWTLAAVGEEVAYRGYLLTRLTDVLGRGRPAVVVAALTSSVLFGLAHTEQGAVGVLLSTVDGLAFASLRHRYGTVWAPVLAHGFINTVGLVSYYAVGPFYGLW